MLAQVNSSTVYSKQISLALFPDDILRPRPIMDFSSNLFTSSSSVADTMPSFRTHFHPSPSLKSFAATAFVTPAADEMDMDGMPSHPNGPSTILVPEQLQSSRVRFNLSFNLDFVADDAGGTYPYTRSICSATWRKPSHSSSHFYRNPDTFSIPQPSVPPILARPTPLCSSFMPFIVTPTSLPYPRSLKFCALVVNKGFENTWTSLKT